DQSINQSKITKNLSQNEVHSDPDLILYNPSVLIDKEPIFFIYRLQKNKPQGSMVSLEVLHFLIKMY
ncbi:hypothetical protein ACTFV8_12875, partial [Enterococcus faecium]|nr:hypothetical protein [Enterococcus faecium]MDW8787103.1 hypothetical protein [Enterococcus faecium]MDW8790040.1 hypothetical protein [Enterococcus faecium]MDW8812139.1 hypothetical protein [Enterococcus faecium]MDW8824603.1 hypothetical protein [Enterococcus faecium]